MWFCDLSDFVRIRIRNASLFFFFFLVASTAREKTCHENFQKHCTFFPHFAVFSSQLTRSKIGNCTYN